MNNAAAISAPASSGNALARTPPAARKLPGGHLNISRHALAAHVLRGARPAGNLSISPAHYPWAVPPPRAPAPPDIDALRERKLERYRRVAQMAREGEAFPRTPVAATSRDAEDLVRRFPVACLEFWARWCAPCLRMQPVIDELAPQFWGDIAFVRVSLDESPDARDRWNVTVLPTMIITHKGHEAARRQGALSRRRLEQFLEPYAAARAIPPPSGSSAPPGRRGGD
jgi:thioredoxin 1